MPVALDLKDKELFVAHFSKQTNNDVARFAAPVTSREAFARFFLVPRNRDEDFHVASVGFCDVFTE